MDSKVSNTPTCCKKNKQTIYLIKVNVALILRILHYNICQRAIYRRWLLWEVLPASMTHSFIDVFCSSGHLCLKTSAPIMNWLGQKAQIIPAFRTVSARLKLAKGEEFTRHCKHNGETLKENNCAITDAEKDNKRVQMLGNIEVLITAINSLATAKKNKKKSSLQTNMQKLHQTIRRKQSRLITWLHNQTVTAQTTVIQMMD